MPAGSASLNHPSGPSTRDGLVDLHGEDGDVVLLQIVVPEQWSTLAMQAASGDHEAGRALDAISQLISKVFYSTPQSPIRCGACGWPIRPMRFACALVQSRDVGSPLAGLGTAICQDCGTKPADILFAAEQAMRKHWPNTRIIRQTHLNGGRA